MHMISGGHAMMAISEPEARFVKSLDRRNAITDLVLYIKDPDRNCA